MKPVGYHKLRRYQKEDADELSSGRKHGLINCAGSGKTASTLAALAIREPPLPWLILTTAIGRKVWPRDAQWLLGPDYVPGELWGAFSHGQGYHASDGSYTSLDLLLSERVAAVTNYEILQDRFEELIQIPWGALILDESHVVKGGYKLPETDADGNIVRTRYHYTKELAVMVRLRRGVVWLVTATPIRDRRRDLWSQLDLVIPGEVLPGPRHQDRKEGWRRLNEINAIRAQQQRPPISMRGLYTTINDMVCMPGPFGISLVYPEIDLPEPYATSFLRRYCSSQQGQYGLVHDKESLTEELEHRLRTYFVKRTRKDIARELPHKQRIVQTVQPKKKRVPRKYMGGGVEEAIARAAWGKIDHAIEIVLEHVAEGERAALIVTRVRLAHEVLKEVEKASKKLPPVVRRSLQTEILTRHLDPRARKKRADEFNQGTGPGILVASMDAIGVSIDLHMIPVVVVLALPPTPGQLDQFEGRFGRFGGIPVTIYYLLADGTIDIRIRDILGDKLVDVSEVGVDTDSAKDAEEDLRTRKNDEAILAELREFLSGIDEFESE